MCLLTRARRKYKWCIIKKKIVILRYSMRMWYLGNRWEGMYSHNFWGRIPVRRNICRSHKKCSGKMRSGAVSTGNITSFTNTATFIVSSTTWFYTETVNKNETSLIVPNKSRSLWVIREGGPIPRPGVICHLRCILGSCLPFYGNRGWRGDQVTRST